MSNSNRLLNVLGIENNVFFFANKIFLYDKGKNKPFAFVEMKNGITTLSVGGDLTPNGLRVDIKD